VAKERLDRTDRALVEALQKDARISNKDLARHVGLAPSTCLERVRALRARGVLRGFHADVDRDTLGRSLEAIVAVRIRPHSRAFVDAFREAALAMPEVIELFHVTGADENLGRFERQRERFAGASTERLDALARCERTRDALVQRLLEAMTAVTRLRTQQAELAGESDPTLGDLTRELQAEADAQAAAAREIEALLAS